MGVRVNPNPNPNSLARPFTPLRSLRDGGSKSRNYSLTPTIPQRYSNETNCTMATFLIRARHVVAVMAFTFTILLFWSLLLDGVPFSPRPSPPPPPPSPPPFSKVADRLFVGRHILSGKNFFTFDPTVDIHVSYHMLTTGGIFDEHVMRAFDVSTSGAQTMRRRTASPRRRSIRHLWQPKSSATSMRHTKRRLRRRRSDSSPQRSALPQRLKSKSLLPHRRRRRRRWTRVRSVRRRGRHGCRRIRARRRRGRWNARWRRCY